MPTSEMICSPWFVLESQPPKDLDLKRCPRSPKLSSTRHKFSTEQEGIIDRTSQVEPTIRQSPRELDRWGYAPTYSHGSMATTTGIPERASCMSLNEPSQEAMPPLNCTELYRPDKLHQIRGNTWKTAMRATFLIPREELMDHGPPLLTLGTVRCNNTTMWIRARLGFKICRLS